jgi:hypothetical protein
MATFRIRDLVIRVGLARKPGDNAGDAAAGGAMAARECANTRATECIGETRAMYACLQGASVGVDCGGSETQQHLAMFKCEQSVQPLCAGSETHLQAMHRCINTMQPGCAGSETHQMAVVVCGYSTQFNCAGSETQKRAINLLQCAHGASHTLIERLSEGELDLLKRQLAEVLHKVEEREETLKEEALREARPPETVEEVEELERKLSEVQEELRSLRARLKSSDS